MTGASGDAKMSAVCKKESLRSKYTIVCRRAAGSSEKRCLSRSRATCRFFRSAEDGVYLIGRIAVMPEYRGKGVGAMIVSEAEKMAAEAGGNFAVVHAQTRASGFYAGLGYVAFGEPDDEEGVPHVWMRKALRERLSV